MSKRMQVILSHEAYEKVFRIHKHATEGHPTVKLNLSDVVEEFVLSGKVSVSSLRAKHTDLRRTLMDLAKKKDVSVEDIVSSLAEIKGGLTKRETKKLAKAEVAAEQ